MAQSTEARKWLLDNGYKVKPKGRIPADLLAIYQAKDKANDLGDSGVRRSDALRAGEEDAPKKKGLKRRSCGFCATNTSYRHKYCPGTINQGKLGIWVCLCYEKGHTL